MISREPTTIPIKNKLYFVVLGLIGLILVLVATNRYGSSLSMDSVRYIAAARHIGNGSGVLDHQSSPLVVQPPLYPIILATLGNIGGKDPIFFANVINAVLFGLIVYLGGLLTYKHLTSLPTLALVGTFAFAFSPALFQVSVHTWSEPLFICFVLLSLLSAQSYLVKPNTRSLLFLSFFVALASLTRYIGVTLILWGGLIIFFYFRDNIKNRVAHLSLFTLISTLPLGLWLIRNLAVSNTLFGPRSHSTFTLSQNITFVFTVIMSWYIPGIHAIYYPTLLLLGAVFFFIFSLRERGRWHHVSAGLRQTGPLILFISIYTIFLVISSTATAFDQIDYRLLSPIYIPLTLLLLILSKALAMSYGKRLSFTFMNSYLLICLAIWLVIPIRSTVVGAAYYNAVGDGYMGKAWLESKITQHLLQQQTLDSECVIYSNGPDAFYILTNNIAKVSPSRQRNNAPVTINDLSWPEESHAFLVWFDKINRKYLFTVDELREITNISLITHLEDGAIYSITKK